MFCIYNAILFQIMLSALYIWRTGCGRRIHCVTEKYFALKHESEEGGKMCSWLYAILDCYEFTLIHLCYVCETLFLFSMNPQDNSATFDGSASKKRKAITMKVK